MTRLLFFLLAFALLAHAQEALRKVPLPSPQNTTKPTGSCDEYSGDVKKACDEAFSAYFHYHTKGLEHRRDVFTWQHFSTRVTFVTVLVLVGLGIYFAWVQFHTRPADAQETTQIELGSKGIKVSSPVLGVIILVLSLAFFYLYLVHVYPIKVVD